MCKLQIPLKFQHEALIISSLAKCYTDNPSFDAALEITATEGHSETTIMKTENLRKVRLLKTVVSKSLKFHANP
jgi:hypothetical protein